MTCFGGFPAATEGWIQGDVALAKKMRIGPLLIWMKSSVDGAIGVLGTAYNTQRLPYLYTTYSNAAGTSVAN